MNGVIMRMNAQQSLKCVMTSNANRSVVSQTQMRYNAKEAVFCIITPFEIYFNIF